MDLDVNTNNVMDNSAKSDKYKDIDVSVGIVANSHGQLLIAKRPAHWMGGGFWEFPGGKIEPEEDSQAALKRELLEEVGIVVEKCTRLINFSYTYPERTVRLNAWIVDSYTGNAQGLEGQEICWCLPAALKDVNMLPANRAIVIATQLPDTYLITPECQKSDEFLLHLEQLLARTNIKLIQLRSKQLAIEDYLKLAVAVSLVCRNYEVSLMLNNDDLSVVKEIDCDGLHLQSKQLMELKHRPKINAKWLSASCHSIEQVQQAQRIGVDFITISPVNNIGWKHFEELVSISNLPVYALGGMSTKDIPKAKELGAQGIAAIKSLWNG